MKKIFFGGLIVLLLAACNSNPLKKVDLSGVSIDYHFHNFDQDLFASDVTDQAAFSELRSKYPYILPLFTTEIIHIGYPEDDGTVALLDSFLRDTLIQSVKTQVDETIDRDKLSDELEQAFTYYKYYFPEQYTPRIFTCVSGFNQSIVMTDSVLGVGLDKYLGADCEYYPQLGIYNYQTINMHPQKIVPDAMYAWAMASYPFKDYGQTLIDKMIYEGKLLYTLDALLPDTPDSLKIGFTAKQLEFCENSEASMWQYLAEYQMLFSTNRMDIIRYTSSAPYTSSFSSDSPGRTGNWLGWQIVRSYMKKNKDITLKQLMEDKDCKKILNQSGYQPK